MLSGGLEVSLSIYFIRSRFFLKKKLHGSLNGNVSAKIKESRLIQIS